MDKFTKCGNRERYLMTWFLNQVGVTDAQFTPAYGYDRHDMVFGSNIIAETKVREYASDDPYFKLKVSDLDLDIDPSDATAYFKAYDELKEHPRYGYLIEKKKWDYLKEQAAEHQLVPIYINFFTDGACKVWRLDTEPRWFIQGCPRSTCGDTTREGKQVALLETAFWSKPLNGHFQPKN